MSIHLLTLGLTVIDFCKSNPHEWYRAERTIGYRFARVTSLTPEIIANKFGLD